MNKPKVYYTQKSLQFFLKDRRKMISAIAIVMLPVLDNVWRLVPKNVYFPLYEELHIFVWTFCVHLLLLVMAVAWFFSIPKKDNALKFITLSAVAYSVFLTLETLPFADETPLWVDVVFAFIIFLFIYFCIDYIKGNYLSKPSDYKVLHDGLVYDIHHQRFLGSINRIAGLLEVSEMDETYRKLCKREINEIKESIAYIADKYDELK